MKMMKTTVLAAAAAAVLAGCSPRLGEEAARVKDNFVESCVAAVKKTPNGRVLDNREAAMLCECTHDGLYKKYPDETAWLQAVKRYEKTGKDFEFQQKSLASSRSCVNSRNNTFTWKIKYYWRALTD